MSVQSRLTFSQALPLHHGARYAGPDSSSVSSRGSVGSEMIVVHPATRNALPPLVSSQLGPARGAAVQPGMHRRPVAQTRNRGDVVGVPGSPSRIEDGEYFLDSQSQDEAVGHAPMTCLGSGAKQ